MTRRDPIAVIVGNDADARPLRLTGRYAQTLRALIEAGDRGVTALEISTWALRLSHYVFVLRREHGLEIEMQREPHDGGWHGRYFLRTPVCILDSAAVGEAA